MVHTDVAQAAAFQQCVPLSSWPALDVMQTPYSTLFLGSYNKAFILLVAMWLFTSFAVYTAWLGVETQPNSNGKPSALLARCGMGLTLFCVVWNLLGGLVMVVVKAFGSPVSAGGFPMTVQTVFVTGVAVLLGSGYFLRELWEQGLAGSSEGYAAVPASSSAPAPGSDDSVKKMGGFVRIPAGPVVVDMVDQQYTPLLAPAWSDALLICDGLLLMGVVGTSSDVVAVDLIRCFLLVLYAAAAHTAFIRLFYEGYVNDVPKAKEGTVYFDLYNANKDRAQRWDSVVDPNRRGLHIMTLLANLSGFCFAAPCWGLLYWRYAGSPLICTYVFFASMFPALVWLLYNILVDFEWLTGALGTASQIGFIYAAFVRATFVFIVAVAATAQGDANDTLRRMLLLMDAGV